MAEGRKGTFDKTRAWLELMSFVAVVGGIIVGFAEHFSSQAQERREVVEAVYTALDDEYRDYLGRLVEYPRLARHRRSAATPPPTLTVDEQTQRRVLDEFLIDLFERAYLEYNDPAKVPLMRAARRAQWAGWEQDLDRQLTDAAFRAQWRAVGETFDTRFQAYVERRLALVPSSSP